LSLTKKTRFFFFLSENSANFPSRRLKLFFVGKKTVHRKKQTLDFLCYRIEKHLRELKKNYLLPLKQKSLFCGRGKLILRGSCTCEGSCGRGQIWPFGSVGRCGRFSTSHSTFVLGECISSDCPQTYRRYESISIRSVYCFTAYMGNKSDRVKGCV